MGRYALVLTCDRDGVVAGKNVGDAHVLDDGLKIGRAPSCDIVIVHRSVNRINCTLRKRPGGWTLVDMGGQNGVWVNERRVRGSQLLADGDEIHYPGARLALRVVGDRPFDRLGRFRDYVLFGVPCIDSPGRRRAFRLKSGGAQRVLIMSHALDSDAVPGGSPLHAPVLEEIRDGDLVHRIYPDHAGVAAKDFVAVDGHLGDAVRSLTNKVLVSVDRCVVTWDGDVFCEPTLDGPSSVVYGTATRWDRARLADCVRHVFPERWAREQLLREQLDTLDDAGVAWLLGEPR